MHDKTLCIIFFRKMMWMINKLNFVLPKLYMCCSKITVYLDFLKSPSSGLFSKWPLRGQTYSTLKIREIDLWQVYRIPIKGSFLHIFKSILSVFLHYKLLASVPNKGLCLSLTEKIIVLSNFLFVSKSTVTWEKVGKIKLWETLIK